MNPIPDDDAFEELFKAIFGEAKFQKASDLKWYDANGNEIFPEESKLDRLDKKYAHIFDELEKG